MGYDGLLYRELESCSKRPLRLRRVLGCTAKTSKDQTDFEADRLYRRVLPRHYPRNLNYKFTDVKANG